MPFLMLLVFTLVTGSMALIDVNPCKSKRPLTCQGKRAKLCYTAAALCDQVPDCIDGADEIHCDDFAGGQRGSLSTLLTILEESNAKPLLYLLLTGKWGSTSTDIVTDVKGVIETCNPLCDQDLLEFEKQASMKLMKKFNTYYLRTAIHLTDASPGFLRSYLDGLQGIVSSSQSNVANFYKLFEWLKYAKISGLISCPR